MPGIFISYRRDDIGSAAAPIAQLLKEHVSADRVFFDTADIPGGSDWFESIERGIAGRDALVALIGSRWEGDSESGRRIDEPDDVVRSEIRSSLAADLKQYPVLIDRSEFPRPLPDDIAALATSNAMHLRQDAFGFQLAAIVVRILSDHLVDAGEHVVVTVGDVDIGAPRFLEYLGMPASCEETLFVTRATVQHGVIRTADLTIAKAPTLTLFIAEGASPDQRRSATALVELIPWTRVAVVSSTVISGIAIEEAARQTGLDWFREIAEAASGPVEVVGVEPAGSWWSTLAGRLGTSGKIALGAGALAVAAVGIAATRGGDEAASASAFDSGLEGWQVSGDAQGTSNEATYFSDGSSGYIGADDNVTGGIWYFEPPSDFVNSGADVGDVLAFDIRQEGIGRYFDAYDVILLGEDGAIAGWMGSGQYPTSEWRRYEFFLHEGANWHFLDITDDGEVDFDSATEETASNRQIGSVLAGLSRILIRGEYRFGPDSGFLDNVSLGPSE